MNTGHAISGDGLSSCAGLAGWDHSLAVAATSNSLAYLGQDDLFFERLAAWSWSQSIEPLRVEPDATIVDFGSFLARPTVLLVDVDLLSARGISLVCQLKRRNPSVPWIAIVDRVDMHLTNLALARFHGAESLFVKPYLDFDMLDEVLQSSYRRVHRWRETIEHVRRAGTAEQ